MLDTLEDEPPSAGYASARTLSRPLAKLFEELLELAAGFSRVVTRLSWIWLWMRPAVMFAAGVLVLVVEAAERVEAGVALWQVASLLCASLTLPPLSALPRLVRNVPSGLEPVALVGERASMALSRVAVVVRSPLPIACWSWLRRLLKTFCCEALAVEAPKSMPVTGRIAEVLMANLPRGRCL